MLEILNNHHVSLEIHKRAFKFAQSIEFLNWVLSPPWEEELIDSHKTQKTKRKADSTESSLLKSEVFPSEKEKENGILPDDSNGGLIHSAKACAVLSGNSKLTPRGAGRLLKWKIGQAWISQLSTTPTMLEVSHRTTSLLRLKKAGNL